MSRAKRFLSLGLAIVMTGSLIVSTAVTAAADDDVTIRFYSAWGEAEPGKTTLKEIVEQFGADHPNIHVEMETQGSTQYHEKLVSEIASDTLANVFMHWGGAEMYEAVSSGKVLDLTEHMDAEPEFKAHFADAVLNGVNVRYEDMEGLWGVPLDNVSAAMYYNKALFEQAGITDVPTTWDELLECVEKLKAIDVVPWALGAKDGWRVEHLYSAIFYRMNGVEATKKLADRSMKYSDPEAIAPWEEIQKLVDMEAFGPEPASVDYATEVAMMASGKAAMCFCLSGVTFTGEDADAADDIDCFDFPVFEGKEEFAKNNFGGGDIALGIATNATDEQIEASWELCKALTDVDAASRLLNNEGILVANKDVVVDPEKANRLMPKFMDVINSADAVLTDVVYYDTVSTLLTKIRDVASALVNGQLTPEQAGAEVDAEIEMYTD